MCSPEQRINLFMLADQSIAFGVPGEFVELGCYEGQTARVIASVLQHHAAEQKLHLFDDFRSDFTGQGGVRRRLLHNFQRHDLPEPVIHEGRFERHCPRNFRSGSRSPTSIAASGIFLSTTSR
jgi:O-methyltransferase